jgi:alanine racemase
MDLDTFVTGESAVPPRPTWIEVDADALVNNVRAIRQRIGADCRLCAVVKANAYGHGVLSVVAALPPGEVAYLAVATLQEALQLRSGGVELPILVLGYTPARHAAVAVWRGVTLTLFDDVTAQAVAHAANQEGVSASVHVKVNTGMNRLGLRTEDAPAFLTALRDNWAGDLNVEGLFTHFATADTDRDFAAVQFGRFLSLLNDLEARDLRPPICHAANSAAMLTMPETHLDMVRCGIALYGLDPDDEKTPVPYTFRPLLSWKAEIAQVTSLEPGEGVSYGLEFVAQRPSVVAVIPVGYADGFPRRPLNWGSVLVHGQAAPIVGRVCMDQTIIDVTDIAEAGGSVRQGDEVVLIGQQGSSVLTAEEVARRIGTINYDVVSRILPRVPRLMVGGRV